MESPERRVWGERRPKDRVTLQITLVFTLTLDLHTVYTIIDTHTGPCNCT